MLYSQKYFLDAERIGAVLLYINHFVNSTVSSPWQAAVTAFYSLLSLRVLNSERGGACRLQETAH